MAMDLPRARRPVRCISLGFGCALAAALAAADPLHSREPAYDCFNSGALRVTCTAGRADGRPAAGSIVRVFDQNGELRISGRIDANGHFTFRKPDADYHVVIDTGAGDIVTILGREVT